MILNKTVKTQVYIDLWLETKKHFRSFETIEKRVASFKANFGEKPISSIEQDEIKTWALELRKSRKSTTVKRFVFIAKQIFNFAIEDKIIEINPVYRIFLPIDNNKTQINPFTKEEVRNILNSVNKEDWLYGYLAIAFNTGMRSGEILGLKWEDIDLDNLTINIQRNVSAGKTRPLKTIHSYRIIPLNKKLLPVLENLQNRKIKSKWIFPNNKKEHMYGVNNTYMRWYKLLDSLMIKRRKIYQTRHTFASHLILDNKIPLIHVSKILGHSNLQTTLKIYAVFVEREHLKISRDIELY